MPITNINYQAMQTGNAGNPKAFDIIDGSAYDLGGRIVACFESLDDAGGTFEEMEEEIVWGVAGKTGVSEAVEAKYLGYTYPFNSQFMGRYTKLVPSEGCKFKVYFLM